MKAALPPPPRLSRRQPRTRFRDDLAAVQKRPVLLLAPTTENPPAPCERRPLLHECGSLVCVYVCCWENEPATPRDSRRRRWNKSSPISAGWPAASASTVAALGLVFWPARYGQAAALVRSTRESQRRPTRTFAPTRGSVCLHWKRAERRRRGEQATDGWLRLYGPLDSQWSTARHGWL